MAGLHKLKDIAKFLEGIFLGQWWDERVAEDSGFVKFKSLSKPRIQK